jgi:hypothetical protein
MSCARQRRAGADAAGQGTGDVGEGENADEAALVEDQRPAQGARLQAGEQVEHGFAELGRDDVGEGTPRTTASPAAP